ncbi:hypothetical protein HQ520_17935 [bacterium]|nr:hypothetical protein [bacterium]
MKTPLLLPLMLIVLCLTASSQAQPPPLQFSRSKMFGPGTELRTNPETGTLDVEWNEKFELMKAIVKNDVYVKLSDPDNMEMHCDYLTYLAAERRNDKNTAGASTDPNTTGSIVIAHGKPVRVLHPAFRASCSKLEVFPQTETAVLTGEALIQQRLPGGEWDQASVMSGEKITVTYRNGSVSLHAEGKAGINPPTETPGEGKPPRVLDESQRPEIKLNGSQQEDQSSESSEDPVNRREISSRQTKPLGNL